MGKIIFNQDNEQIRSTPKSKRLKVKKFNKRGRHNPEIIEKIKERLEKRMKKVDHTRTSATDNADDKNSLKHRRKRSEPVRLENIDVKYEENDVMTQMNGVWVSREALSHLNCARDKMVQRGMNEATIDKQMKQLVRRAHRQLKLRLIGSLSKDERDARERRQFLLKQSTPTGKKRHRKGLPAKSCGLRLSEDTNIAGDDGGDQAATQAMEKFDGFWVSSAGAARLRALKAQLALEQVGSDAAAQLRRARRHEERLLKMAGRMSCGKCGARGHQTTDCQAQAVPAAQAAAGGACFRCGNIGHRLSDCPLRPATGDSGVASLPFATCFVCRQTGHMARHCPENKQQQEQESASVKQRTGGKRSSSSTLTPSWRGAEHDTGADEKTATTKRHDLAATPSSGEAKHIRF